MKAALFAEVSAAAAKGPEGLASLSLAASEEWVTNSRGLRLHVRTATSKTAGAKGIVVFVHGIGAHCSRPNWTLLSKYFTESLGYHYAAFDFAGHGYSAGLKGYIGSPEDLLDDLSSFLDVLYRPSSSSSDSSQVKLPALDPSNTPFFLLGSSMGGAVSLLLAHLATQSSDVKREALRGVAHWGRACSGCILSAPALLISKPPAAIIFVLDWIVSPLLPTALLPAAFSSSKPDSLTWELDAYGDYVQADPLSRSGPLMFRTAGSVVRLIDAVGDAVPAIGGGSGEGGLRVLVLMDPDDGICLFAGAERLQEMSPLAARGGVKLVPMPGARHDVLTNRMDEAVEVVAQWLQA